jgi:hypothetical protein
MECCTERMVFKDAGLIVRTRAHWGGRLEAEQVCGSLVPRGFGGRQGTAAPLMLQTYVNEPSKPKHFRGDWNAFASPSARTETRAKRAASRRPSVEPNRPMATPDPPFHPARGLMICMGWLRLFQAIVPDMHSARSPLPNET